MGTTVMGIRRIVRIPQTFFFLVIWTFAESGKPSIIPEEELPPNIVKVMDAHGNTTKPTQVTECKDIKMLGVIKAATLDKTDKFKYLMDHTTTYMRAT
eukprot:2768004-Ditylum_brightwellii.AAC.1